MYLASPGNINEINLWDSQSYKLVAAMRGHKSPVRCLSFSKANDMLVSADEGGRIIIWEIPAGNEVTRVRINRFLLTITSMTFDGSNRVLITDNVAVLGWDWKKNTLERIQHTRKPEMPCRTETTFVQIGDEFIRVADVIINQSKSFVHSIGKDQAHSLLPTVELPASIQAFDFHPTKTSELAIVDFNVKHISFWDLSTAPEFQLILPHAPIRQSESVICFHAPALRYSNTGNKIALGAFGCVLVFDVESRHQLCCCPFEGVISCLSFESNDSSLAICSRKQFWQAHSLTRLDLTQDKPKCHVLATSLEYPIYCACFSGPMMILM